MFVFVFCGMAAGSISVDPQSLYLYPVFMGKKTQAYIFISGSQI
jgi:hypothetical protein